MSYRRIWRKGCPVNSLDNLGLFRVTDLKATVLATLSAGTTLCTAHDVIVLKRRTLIQRWAEWKFRCQN